jgi:hypothetical protein
MADHGDPIAGFGLFQVSSQPGFQAPRRDGRVRNPVPSKLKGKTNARQGNFAVMHLGFTPSLPVERTGPAMLRERPISRPAKEHTAVAGDSTDQNTAAVLVRDDNRLRSEPGDNDYRSVSVAAQQALTVNPLSSPTINPISVLAPATTPVSVPTMTPNLPGARIMGQGMVAASTSAPAPAPHSPPIQVPGSLLGPYPSEFLKTPTSVGIVANPAMITYSSLTKMQDPEPQAIKSEQSRLLHLLRSLHPAIVVDRLCTGLVYFGGTPDASHPTDGVFPQSAHGNGSGALFVSWLAEIFSKSISEPLGLHPDQPIHDTYPPTLTAQESVPRRRGRPKGSKGTRARKDKGLKKTRVGASTPHGDGEVFLTRGVDAMQSDLPPDASDPYAPTSSAENVSALATPVHAIMHAESSSIVDDSSPKAKRRGRPKGSKNRPKGIMPPVENNVQLTDISLTPEINHSSMGGSQTQDTSSGYVQSRVVHNATPGPKRKPSIGESELDTAAKRPRISVVPTGVRRYGISIEEAMPRHSSFLRPLAGSTTDPRRVMQDMNERPFGSTRPGEQPDTLMHGMSTAGSREVHQSASPPFDTVTALHFPATMYATNASASMGPNMVVNIGPTSNVSPGQAGRHTFSRGHGPEPSIPHPDSYHGVPYAGITVPRLPAS